MKLFRRLKAKKLLRVTVRLHPALIILGLIVGAGLGGFWGLVLTVPVMASVKILVGHFWRTRVLGQSWDGFVMLPFRS